ncbi:MAG: hypothetical protein ACQESR_24060 [Planctomycetota bacterium]
MLCVLRFMSPTWAAATETVEEKTPRGQEQTGQLASGEEGEKEQQEDNQAPASPKAPPKALRKPVDLVPVEEGGAGAADDTSASNSTPPIQLVPEPSLPPATGSEQGTSEIDGIRPASFQGISPGQSTRAELIEQLGEPLEVATSEEKQELVFEVEPFPSARITVTDDVVSSIVINLVAPQAREAVVKDLKLADFEAAIIRDDEDRPLGEVYPERGLMFAYQEEDGSGEDIKVSHVVLERISSEPFLLRVEQTPVEQIAKRRDDLRIARELSPDNAEAHALAARLDRRCGRLEAAHQAARKALESDAENQGYRILVADIERRLGHSEKALQAIRAVLADDSISSLEEAEAQLILGRLLATTSNHDYKQAMKETVTAIKLASAETDASQKRRRWKARRLLIRAELSLAEILAHGPWKQRHSVVPKWLASAEQVINEHIEKDDAARDLLLDLYRTSLHCLLALDGQGTPAKITEAAIQLGRELIADTDDLDYQSVIEWKLGTTLWRAAQVTRQQANTDAALRLADNAEALMSTAVEARSNSPNAAYQLAQLRFLMGSIHAIHKQDHDMAMSWYDKARPRLASPYPDCLLDNRGPVGDQLVSIGISLWETDRRNQAVSVTKEGLEMIRDAVEAGTFKRAALAVPYRNLATMYRGLGNKPEAENMARKAAEYQPSTSSSNIRR